MQRREDEGEDEVGECGVGVDDAQTAKRRGGVGRVGEGGEEDRGKEGREGREEEKTRKDGAGWSSTN